jgi:hypothetical protein
MPLEDEMDDSGGAVADEQIREGWLDQRFSQRGKQQHKETRFGTWQAMSTQNTRF